MCQINWDRTLVHIFEPERFYPISRTKTMLNTLNLDIEFYGYKIFKTNYR